MKLGWCASFVPRHPVHGFAQNRNCWGPIARDLAAREYSELEIEEVLSFLWKHGLLNDLETTKSLVESYSGRRSIGKGKLRAELMRRGAPEDLIEQCLEGQTDDGELDAMRQALGSKRWPADGRIRAARFLVSRGFDEELVERALNRFFGDESSASD